MRVDAIGIVEAAYAVDVTEEEWLKGILERTGAALDGGLGAVAYLYDASVNPRRTWGHLATIPMPHEQIVAACSAFEEDYVRKHWLTQTFGAGSEFPGFFDHPAVVHQFRPQGIQDAVALNALDPSGVGCWISVPQPKVARIKEADRAHWSRLAAHVTAGLRLRRRLEGARAALAEAADAVFTPNGKVEDRGAAATDTEIDALRDATVAIDRARGRLRKSNQEDAVRTWKALVRGRWSLVDHFERGGRRYVVACSNEPRAAESPKLSSLTAREQQVVAYADQGHDTKLIAYELGIAPATVRVLLGRAAQKLHATSRDDLVARYRRLRGKK